MDHQPAVIEVCERAAADPVEQLGAIGRGKDVVVSVGPMGFAQSRGNRQQVQVVIAEHGGDPLTLFDHPAKRVKRARAAIDQIAGQPERRFGRKLFDQAEERVEATLQVADDPGGMHKRDGWLAAHPVAVAGSSEGLDDIAQIGRHAKTLKHPGIGVGEQFGGRHVDALNLGEAGDAWPGLEDPACRADLDQFLLTEQARAGAHHTHLAFENVPELRQFIELGSTHHRAQRRDHGRVDQVRGYRLGALPHGAKLDQRERPLVPPHADLSEDRRSGIKVSQYQKDQHDGCGDDQSDRCKHDIEKTQHRSYLIPGIGFEAPAKRAYFARELCWASGQFSADARCGGCGSRDRTQ